MVQVAVNFLRDFSKVPPRLYHYTSLEAMTKIIQGHNIWATDFAYFHDPEEVWLFSRILLECLDERLQTIGASNRRYILSDAESHVQMSNGIWYVCVACFSQQRSQLSQFRAYSGDRGCSLGFSGESLARLAASNDFMWGSVVYDVDEQKRLAASLIERNCPEELIKRTTTDKADSAVSEISRLVANISVNFGPLFKSAVFDEEREFRFWRVLGIDEIRVHGDYRAAKSRGLVPYVPLAFGVDSLSDDDEIIDGKEGVMPELVPSPGVWTAKDCASLYGFCIKHGIQTLVDGNQPDYRWGVTG